MKITNNIYLSGFRLKKKMNKLKNILNFFLNEKSQVLLSLSKNYKNSFNIKNLKKYKNNSTLRLIGIGGSILGSQAIYDFLKKKIKKKFFFVDNLVIKQKF